MWMVVYNSHEYGGSIFFMSVRPKNKVIEALVKEALQNLELPFWRAILFGEPKNPLLATTKFYIYHKHRHNNTAQPN